MRTIQEAFASQSQGIAEKLADAVIDSDKAEVETQDHLQYKQSIVNAQNAMQTAADLAD